MTVYVIRNGKVVVKPGVLLETTPRPPAFPMPSVSRFTPMESPVTGKEITSWRDRDRDMEAAGAVDPRDLPRGPIDKRREENARSYDSIWTDPDPSRP